MKKKLTFGRVIGGFIGASGFAFVMVPMVSMIVGFLLIILLAAFDVKIDMNKGSNVLATGLPVAIILLLTIMIAMKLGDMPKYLEKDNWSEFGVSFVIAIVPFLATPFIGMMLKYFKITKPFGSGFVGGLYITLAKTYQTDFPQILPADYHAWFASGLPAVCFAAIIFIFWVFLWSLFYYGEYHQRFTGYKH